MELNSGCAVGLKAQQGGGQGVLRECVCVNVYVCVDESEEGGQALTPQVQQRWTELLSKYRASF